MNIIPTFKKIFCCGGENSHEIGFITKNDESNSKEAGKSLSITDSCHISQSIVYGIQPLSALDIYEMSESEIEDNNESRVYIPIGGHCLPQKREQKPTLVLDLDNTLIFSTMKKVNTYDHEIIINYNGREQPVWIIERPGLGTFLSYVSEKFELILFTAGIRQYGIKVLRKIDRARRISYLLDRRFCTAIGKNNKNQDFFAKDIRILGRELTKTLLVDDKAYSFFRDHDNGILVPVFNGDLEDTCLEQLKDYLDHCYNLSDMRVRKPFLYKK